MVQVFLCVGVIECDGDDFGGFVGFFEVQCFFDGVFIEGVDVYFDVSGFDVEFVCLWVYVYVVINDLFEGDQNFYLFILWCDQLVILEFVILSDLRWVF